MRAYLTLTILILLPVLLAGTIFRSPLSQKVTPFNGIKHTDRTWRLNEVMDEQHDGMNWNEGGTTFYIYSQEHPTRLDTLKYCYWNPDTQVWEPALIRNITWDNTNEYVTQMNQFLVFMGIEIPFMRGSYSYDNQNRLTSFVYEYYDGEQEVWMTGFRFLLVYNTNTDYTVYQYEAPGEEPEMWRRQNFVWDAQGRIIQEMGYTSPDSLNWGLSSNAYYTYHPHDTTTGDIFVSNVAHYVPLQDIYDNTNAVDFFGMVSEEIYEWWNGVGWEQERTLYTYNDDDILTLKLEQYSLSENWVNSYRTEYTYDTNNNLYQKTEMYWQDPNWMPENRLTCSWGQVNAADDNTVPPLAGLAVQTSPNPFGSEVRITVRDKFTQPANLSVYNTRGQLVRKLDTTTNTTITWDGKDDKNRAVSDGIYFIRATVNGRTGTIRTLKLK